MVTLANTFQTLQKLKPLLIQKDSVSTLGLLGSLVRNDFCNDSDIDILVGFSSPIGIEFISLADELEQRLQCRVDLV